MFALADKKIIIFPPTPMAESGRITPKLYTQGAQPKMSHNKASKHRWPDKKNKLFLLSRTDTFLLLEGYITGLHGDVFPSWVLNLSSLVFMGFFLINLAVQVQAISFTPLSPGWAPAVNLVLWYHCWITTWESDPPEWGEGLRSQPVLGRLRLRAFVFWSQLWLQLRLQLWLLKT